MGFDPLRGTVRAHRLISWRTGIVPRAVAALGVGGCAASPPDGTVAPLASWGTPAKVVPVGQVTVYVYDHDIAAQLGEGG